MKREDVFITTKLWSTYHSRVELGLEKSLKSLGVDYVDLYLMHWPIPLNPNGFVSLSFESPREGSADDRKQNLGNHDKFPRLPDGSRDLQMDWTYIQTWKQMERLLETGKAKVRHAIPLVSSVSCNRLTVKRQLAFRISRFHSSRVSSPKPALSPPSIRSRTTRFSPNTMSLSFASKRAF